MAGNSKTMPTNSLSVVIRHLVTDLSPLGATLTDGELLARFVRSRDEDALAALVRRHAPMVWGVCRRLLNHHDAEDAFQAAFLVLVCKAAGVPRQAVANWLYGVARQTAVRLRATAAKRGRRETQVVTMPESGVRGQGSGVRSQESADLQRVVDEELSRLPDHYRGVIVLCDLEGMTRKEAARQLGLPEGSVASRLARARVMLARRLTRRGIVFSGGSAAAVLSADSASSAPPTLVASTIKAASLLAAGQAAGVVSAKVAALTEGMVNAMFLTKIKAALSVVLILCFMVTGATLFTYRSAAGQANKKAPAEEGVEQATPQAKIEAEEFIAWGKEVGGLQAGLSILDRNNIRIGGKATAVARLRNVSNKAITVSFEEEFGPHVVDALGKPVRATISPVASFDIIPWKITVEAGQTIQMSKSDIFVLEVGAEVPSGPEVKLNQHTIYVSPGTYKAGFGGFSKGHPTLSTGTVEFKVNPAAPNDQTTAEEKPAQTAKTDRERMIGNWVITNKDSQRKGEMWVIYEDSILMYANYGGINAYHYAHQLDAGKSPRQIDITVSRIKGPVVGEIKGIYVLEGDELRLCLGAMDKDRPAAFPETPKPGEVLVLQRGRLGAKPPTAKEAKPAQSDQERMVGEWVIINADSRRKGEQWFIYKDHLFMYGSGIVVRQNHFLDAGKDPRQIDINYTKMNGADTIKGIYLLDGDELRLCLGERGKDRPAAFPEKPGPGEVLILQRQKPGAEKPKAKEEQPSLSDQERMVGDWVITNADSKYQGQRWIISKDRIVMNAYGPGGLAFQFYSLNAGKDPKQIDMAPPLATGSLITKGIYALDGDELRLCLADRGKDRPAAFPKKPGPGEVLILQRQKPGAEKPKAKEEQPALSDQERMVGDWVIANADSKYRTDMTWTITRDRIHRHSNIGGFQMQWYHRLDASKNPRQIDIAGQLNGPTIYKGIYLLDGDELRLCLGDAGKDRPATFPRKPVAGEVTILHRIKQAAEPTTVKQVQPAVETRPKVLNPEEAIKQKLKAEEAIKQKVTVKFKVTATQTFLIPRSNVVGESAATNDEGCYLKDGDRFYVQLLPPVMDAFRRLGTEPDKLFRGKVVQVTGQLQPGPSPSQPGEFQIVVNDLTQIEVVKE